MFSINANAVWNAMWSENFYGPQPNSYDAAIDEANLLLMGSAAVSEFPDLGGTTDGQLPQELRLPAEHKVMEHRVNTNYGAHLPNYVS